MPSVLTTKEATVQTVAVEIQALKVGKKQVTMGLFRQLPCTAVLDSETIHLAGVPWGHVNYWWEGDGHHAIRAAQQGSLHIVWQSGSHLFRDICYQAPDPHWLRPYKNARDGYINALFLLMLPNAHTWIDREPPCGFLLPQKIQLDTQVFHLVMDENDLRVALVYWKWKTTGTHLYASMACPQEQYEDLLTKYGIRGMTSKSIQAGLEANTARLNDYTQRWAHQWQALAALPQLFIAV